MALADKMKKHLFKIPPICFEACGTFSLTHVDGITYFALICRVPSHIQLGFLLIPDCLLVDSAGCSHYNAEACVANAAVTRGRSAHS